MSEPEKSVEPPDCPKCGSESTSLTVNTFQNSIGEFLFSGKGSTLPITVGCWSCGWKEERSLVVAER